MCFFGTALIENRNGLAVDRRLSMARGVSECLAAIDLADQHIPKGGTLAGDEAFGTVGVVAVLRERRITPHVALNAYGTGKARRRSNIDGRTTGHAGHAASQKCRMRIEQIFARRGLLTSALSRVDRCAPPRDA